MTQSVPIGWQRRFYTIWAGQALSLLGSRLVQFALVWWITDEVGSASALAGATLCAVLPQVLLGPLAGALVDRYSRRVLLITADLANALAVAWLAVLFAGGRAQLWHIYLALAIRGVGGVIQWPAMRAATTLLVPSDQLTRVGGMNQTLHGLAGLTMPALGAVAIVALPMQSVLAIDIVTALLAILPLLWVRIPNPERSTQSGTLWADMRAGLRYVMGWRALLLFAGVGTLCNMLGAAAGSLMPLLVTEHFDQGAMALGWTQSAAGLGAVAGGLALSLWTGIRKRMPLSLLALVADGLIIVGVAMVPRHLFGLALVGIFAMGALESTVLALHGAIGQLVIPAEMQGRVFSLLGTVGGAAMPLGLAIAGPVADRIGVRSWWLATGIVIALTACAALATRSVREIEGAERPSD